LLITGIIIFGLLVTVSIISIRIILNGVNQLEAQRVETNTERVSEAIDTQLDYLRTKTADWAYWDDSYNFVSNRDTSYVSTNLVPTSFVNLKVDSIIYLNEKNVSVYARTYDAKTQQISTASADLIELAEQLNKRLSVSPLSTDVTGFILLPEGPIYISARQILHSDNSGPVAGMVLFVEDFDKEEIARLANVTKTQIEVHRLDEPMQSYDQQMVSTLAKKPFASINLSGTQVAGYAMRKDVNGKNILLLDVIQSRDYYIEGVRDVKILLFAFGGVGLVFLITVLLALEYLVVTPLLEIRKNISSISLSGDLHQRLKDTGSKDELGGLTRDLNSMLQSVEYSKKLLKGEQERSQAYLDVVGVMIVVLSPSGTITLVNQKALDILAITEKDAIGKNWFDNFVPAEEREEIRDQFAKSMAKGQSFPEVYENHVIAKNGTIHLISWHNTVLHNDSGQIISSLSSGEDITRSHQKEEEVEKKNSELESTKQAMLNLLEDAKGLEDKLKEEKEGVEQKVVERTKQLVNEQARLMSSIRSLSLGFIMTNMAGKVVLINDPVKKILDTPSKPAQFDDLVSLFGTTVDIKSLRNSTIEARGPVHVDSMQYKGKWIRLFMAPVITQDEKAEMIGLVILLEDVTEAKILERSRDEFFSIASHELRTPLTAIRGNTSMILDYYMDKLPDSEIKEMIQDIYESSVRLINIVNDFLNVSRLEQQRFVYKKSVFNLVDLAREATKEYQTTGSRQNLSLTIADPPDELPLVYADPDRIREIIINLIGNSMKFTEKGGITIGFSLTSGFVQTTVTDTGRGIPLQNQSLLFHKFQQAGNSLFTRDATQGTGLGLYISKLMIEGMGGKIWLAKSEPDKGSSFAFTVPVADKEGKPVT